MHTSDVISVYYIYRLDMICIRGKRGRPVSVILTPEVKAALDLLVDCRDSFVSLENPYLFARLTGKNPLRGSDLLRNFASEAALEYPERIGSINMRKYIATVVQVCILYW